MVLGNNGVRVMKMQKHKNKAKAPFGMVAVGGVLGAALLAIFTLATTDTKDFSYNANPAPLSFKR